MFPHCQVALYHYSNQYSVSPNQTSYDLITLLIIYCFLLIDKEMYAVTTLIPAVFIETIRINHFTNLIDASNLIYIGNNINLFFGLDIHYL